MRKSKMSRAAVEIDPSLGEFIKKKRMELGISQKELAGRFGLSQPVFICLIESGKSRLPTSWVLKMSKELKVRPERLIKYLVEEATNRIQREIISEEFL